MPRICLIFYPFESLKKWFIIVYDTFSIINLRVNNRLPHIHARTIVSPPLMAMNSVSSLFEGRKPIPSLNENPITQKSVSLRGLCTGHKDRFNFDNKLQYLLAKFHKPCMRIA